MRKSATMFVFIALTVGSGLATGAIAAEYYAAWRFAKIDPPFPWDYETSSATPVVTADHLCDFWCGQGLCGQTAYARFFGQSHANRLRLYASHFPADLATGTCYAGGDARAYTKFQVYFTCQPQVVGPIDVSMNFRATGSSSRPYDPPPGYLAFSHLTVTAGRILGAEPSPFAGRWYSSLNINPAPSTGAFASVPPAPTVNGLFTGPVATIALDANHEATAEFILDAVIASSGNAGTGWMTTSFGFSGVNEGVALPRFPEFPDSPVFNLPAGCTCNSPDAEIVDNFIDRPVAVSPATWSQTKSLYR